MTRFENIILIPRQKFNYSKTLVPIEEKSWAKVKRKKYKYN